MNENERAAEADIHVADCTCTADHTDPKCAEYRWMTRSGTCGTRAWND